MLGVALYYRLISPEGLTEQHWDGILQTGPTKPQRFGMLVLLFGEPLGQLHQGRESTVRHTEDSKLHGGRKHVIGRLAEIDVLIRMDERILTHRLAGQL